MAVLEPEELFQQAELLIQPRQPGPPRQVDVRRAISASYYGLFHLVAASVADAFVGSTKRGDPRYALVYRTLDHGQLRTLCRAIQGPGPDIAPLLKNGTMGQELRQFGDAVLDLQAQRNRADYDPGMLLRTTNAQLAIATARRALVLFGQAGTEERLVFLTLLAFRQRK